VSPHRAPRLVVWLCLAVAACAAVSCRSTPQPADIASLVSGLTQAAQESLAVNYSPVTGRPSFVRGRIPIAVTGVLPTDTSTAVVFGFMRRYAALFGTDSAGQDLRLVTSRVDELGMRHMTLQQVHGGVDVYGATYSVHLSRQGAGIVAVISSAVPDLRVPSTQPAISEDSARAVARSLLLRGTAVSSRVAVYTGRRHGESANLAWVVEVLGEAIERDTIAGADGDTLPDAVPARRDVIIDAARGRPLAMFDRLYTARNRQTHDANHGSTLPGTLARAEGAGPVGIADVDSAHTFVGNTYDYYSATYGRDSYDNAGATLTTTVRFGNNYQNAFWNGAQMVFGDGFAVRDVTAHELTHAVTERTANLEYRWQSGALNESLSDIFGAMVDRDDWLMGEDLPIGAIRDMANPGAEGQPGHTSGWVATCSDNEGVHTNSGIPSKAFVNIATAIGKGDAERIFYRALTVYLQPQSTLEDARAAALQSAQDLFGDPSTQLQAVTSGFAAVGLNGSFQPPVNNCSTVPIPVPASPLAVLVLVALLALAVMLRARAAARRRA